MGRSRRRSTVGRREPSRQGAPPTAAPAGAGARRRWIWALLGAAFLFKLTVLVQLRDYPLLQPLGGLDTAVYVGLARRVAAGDLLLGPGAYYVSPLYIYFAAVWLAASGGALVAIRAAQIVLGTAAVGLVYATAREWFGDRAAWLAAALAALTGMLTFYEVVILQAALEPFLTALHLYLLTRALRTGRLGWYVATGAAIGVHALNRPNLLLWGLALAVLLLVRHGWPRRATLGAAGAVALGLAAAFLPVAARNLAVTGQPSLLPSHGGLNLYVGNNPRADGTYHTVPGITPDIDGQAEDARHVAEQALGRPLTDAEVSDYFTGLALDWMRADPGRAAALFARKLYYVFQRAIIPLNYSYAYYTKEVPSLLPALVVGPWLLVPLGLVGLALGVGRLRRGYGAQGRWAPGAGETSESRLDFALWSAFVPVYAVSVALFFVTTRYRLPLLVPFAIGSGAAVDQAIGWWRARPSSRTLAAAATVTVVLFAAVNWPLGLDDGRGNERTWMAITLIAEGRYDEARALADATQPIHPYPGVMRFRVGEAYRRANRPDLAVTEYEKALAVDRGQPETELALGQTLVDLNRWSDALPHLQRAYQAGYKIDLSGFDLSRARAATGDETGALAVLGALAGRLDVDALSSYALGDQALALGDPALADRFYRDAIARAPDAAVAHEKRGVALSMMNRPDEAIRELEEACRLDAASASARLNLAVALATAGRLPEARARAEEALRIDPDYARARQFLVAIATGG